MLDLTPRDRQTVLFSATLDGDVAKITAEYQTDPIRHEVGEATPDIKAAVHKFWTTERLERNPVVAEVVKAAWPSIIFCRTRHGADRLAKQLGKLDLKAAPIHGGRSQNQRNRALEDFTKGRVHALVATDVAARGIHVDGVASVIHYDPPEDHKAYVHRSGRTARAGAEGLVVSLVQPAQKNELRKMQRVIGLDEPFTSPDADLLPESALTGDRELAPAGPPPREPQERNRSAPRSGRSQRKHGAGRRRSGQGGGRDDGSRDRNRAERSGGRSTSKPSRGSNGGSSGSNGGSHNSPKGTTGRSAQNRKARRAHLQPGAQS